MKKTGKKMVAVMLCVVMAFGLLVGTAPTARAAGYPWLFLSNSKDEFYAGDTITLEFQMWREYNYEIYYVEIYDDSNTMVASAEKQLSKYSTSTSYVDYNVTWDTKDYTPGEYTVKTWTKFYSLYEWHTSPKTYSYTVTLRGSANRPIYGWNSNSIGWWYVKDNGSYFINEWAKLAGTWYYFDGNGYMLTGWANLGGQWYFFNDSGAMMTGWVKIGNMWYYLNEGGAMATGWNKLAGTWYYFDGNGAMATGWAYIGGQWYFFNDGGAMLTGWIYLGGTWYYLNAGGAMVTGWLQDNGNWYYLNGDGSMATGWIFVNNCWYLLNDSGVWVG